MMFIVIHNISKGVLQFVELFPIYYLIQKQLMEREREKSNQKTINKNNRKYSNLEKWKKVRLKNKIEIYTNYFYTIIFTD